MESVEHQAAERHLRAALEQNQFRLCYQPQLDPRTGRVVGAEALLRWRDPAGRLLEPSHFLQALEATGLIVPVGEWAFTQAAEDCRRWQRLGLPRLKIGLNVSPSQLGEQQTQSLASKVAEMRECCELQIEISGAHLLAPPEWLVKSLHTLRFAGADICVQDFGLDDTIHRRLWSLPVDALKIHRSFIARMADDEVDEELAGMLMLARAFRLGSVAEGVETEEQLKRLRQLHCERSQGFLHSHPITADRFEWMLRADFYARGEGGPRIGAAHADFSCHF
jgi:EAL domain-containing protein (putative c-di-GMP-specific phosphodiesterase class I)